MVQEPVGNEVIGQRYKVQPMVYEQFMEAEGIPVVRGIGVADVRDLALAPWKRMGGRGSFLQLDGIRGLSGFYVVEILSGTALNAERHIYEELYYVVEGRGTTEVWKEGSDSKQVFEWQAGSQFIIPLNAWHRIVNAMNTPALLVGVTNAPPLMDLFDDEEFIFNNPYPFNKQYDASDDYFQNNEELTHTPLRPGRSCGIRTSSRTSPPPSSQGIIGGGLIIARSLP